MKTLKETNLLNSCTIGSNKIRMKFFGEVRIPVHQVQVVVIELIQWPWEEI